MSLADARLDALMGRMNNLEHGLYVRADQLEGEADALAEAGTVTMPGRTPDVLRVIAAEFRKMAEWLE